MSRRVYSFYDGISDFFKTVNYSENVLLSSFRNYEYPTLTKYGSYLEDYNAVKELLKNNVSVSLYNALEVLYKFELIQNKYSDRVSEYLKNATSVYNKVLQENYEEITGEYRHDLEYLIGIKPLKTIYQQILDKYGWNE